MPKFVKVEIFTDVSFILSYSILINPNCIIGMKEILYNAEDTMEIHEYTKFWTVDGKEYYSPLKLELFVEKVSYT